MTTMSTSSHGSALYPRGRSDDAGEELSGEGGMSGEPESSGSDVFKRPPRKRPRKSTTTGGCRSSVSVAASARRRVIQTADEKCWLCGYFGKHVAHVIARSDVALFKDYRRRGLITMTDIHHISNLIYLCAGCHNGFDERTPVWTFLPQDLDAFITAEESFQASRTEAAAAGKLLKRPPPENRLQNLPFVRYQIREGYLHPTPFLEQPVKRWAGCPVATILRSAPVVAGLERLHPVEKGGIPDDVALKLQRLLYLYGMPEPKVQVKVDSGDHSRDDKGYSPEDDEKDSPEDDEEHSPEDEQEHHYSASGSVDGTAEGPSRTPGDKVTRSQRQKINATHHDAETTSDHPLTPPVSNPHEGSAVSSARKGRVQRENKFLYGPEMTSNEMIEWAVATRQNANTNNNIQ